MAGIKEFFSDRANFNEDSVDFYLYYNGGKEAYYIKIPDWVDYDDYEIGNSKDGFIQSVIPDFTKYRYSGLLESTEIGEKTTFDNLSDMAKFFILATDQVGGSFSSATIEPGDEDYSILTNIFTVIEREYKKQSASR